jgi:hypothetical protein
MKENLSQLNAKYQKNIGISFNYTGSYGSNSKSEWIYPISIVTSTKNRNHWLKQQFTNIWFCFVLSLNCIHICYTIYLV